MSELGRECLAGGGASALVSALLNPMDVIKTRRQVLTLKQTPLAISRSLYASGGLVALWSPGMRATVAREVLYSGCTKGLYPTVRSIVSGQDEPTLAQRALAAATTGTLGSVFANAIDVVKIRQFHAPESLPTGVYGAMRHIADSEGVVEGLVLRGVTASAPRGAAIAIGEVTTYDYTKSALKSRVEMFSVEEEPFTLHAVTAMITGLVATTVASPFDVLKSRVMAGTSDGFMRTLNELVREEGVKGLLRGWTPAYWRLGPHAMLTFPLMEQLRVLVGLEYF